jgi:nickel transport protein
MRKSPRHVRIMLLAVLALPWPGALASAHDMWITITGTPEARSAIINYGHPDDRPPADAEKVLDLSAITVSGRKSLLDGLRTAPVDGAVVVQSKPFDDAGHALLATRYDNGYWVEIAENFFRNASLRVAPEAKNSLWSVKFAKAVTGAGAPWDRVVGHDLEIVPATDPAAVKAGEPLRVRVLFKGKPLANAKVERGDGRTPMAEADIPKFATNADGEVDIPIIERGPHLLVVDYRVAPSATPELAAADLYNATFWFAVP